MADDVSHAAARFRVDLVWNYASLAILGVSGIAINIVIALVYDSATLGVFNQVVAAYIVFSMLASGGINFSVLRAIAEHIERQDAWGGIVRGAIVPAFFLSTLSAMAFYFLAHPVAVLLDSAAVESGMIAATPGLFFFALNKVFLGVINGRRRMRAFAVYQALRYLLILLGLGLAVAGALPGDWLAGIFSFGEGLLFIALAIDTFMHIPRGKTTDWRRWSGKHLRFGIKSAFSGVLLELNSRVDVLMLGWFMNDSQVGIYSFAALFAEGFFQLLVVLQNNYNPVLAKMISEGQLRALEAVIRKTRWWVYGAVTLAGIIVVILYPLVLPLLTNKPEFTASIFPFAILVGGIVLASGYLPFQNTLSMANHPAWHTLYIAITVTVNIIANGLLIPVLGIEGAALATACSVIASVLFLRGLTRGLIGLRL